MTPGADGYSYDEQTSGTLYFPLGTWQLFWVVKARAPVRDVSADDALRIVPQMPGELYLYPRFLTLRSNLIQYGSLVLTRLSVTIARICLFHEGSRSPFAQSFIGGPGAHGQLEPFVSIVGRRYYVVFADILAGDAIEWWIATQ